MKLWRCSKLLPASLSLIFIMMVLVPRLSIDLFLPGLPNAAYHYHVSFSHIQLSMTVFMLGYAISMLITGPLSDHFGSRRVAFYGIGLFSLASIICFFAPNAMVLIIARFFQALGGCCGTVIARVGIRTMFSKEEQIHFLAMLSTAMAISPIIGPIVGSSIVHYLTWNWVFIILFLVGVGLLYLLNAFPESTSKAGQLSPARLMRNYKSLLSDRYFVGYSLTIGLAWFNYFAFTVESPLLLQKILHFDVMQYGYLFALAVSGYVIGTWITRYWANRLGWDHLILIACAISLMASFIMAILLVLQPLTWYNLILPMIMIMLSVGIIIPCTQASVLQPYNEIAATASGLFFFIQMMFGFLAGLVVPLWSTRPVSLALLMFVISCAMGLLFYGLIYRKKKTDENE